MEQARRESSARYEELGREIILTPKLWDAFFEINQGSSMEYIAITGHKRELHFLKQEPPVRFRLIAEEEKGFQIKNSSAAVNQRRGQAVCKASAEYLSVFR